MAGVKISNLPAIVTPALSDVFPVSQAGVTYKETVSQLQSLLTLNSVSPAQIQNKTYSYFVDTGVANAYVITPSPASVAIVAGQEFDVLISNTNTGPSTLNPNGLGADSIKLANGSDPFAGNLLAGMIATFQFDGTFYQLKNPAMKGLVPTIAFSAYNSVATSCLGGVVFTKIGLQTETYDIGGCFDTTLSRFTPTVPGIYHISGQVWINSPNVVANQQYNCAIYKNGAVYVYGNAGLGIAGANVNSAVSVDISMNGTTDYLELFFLNSNAVNAMNTNNSALVTWLTGHWARALT